VPCRPLSAQEPLKLLVVQGTFSKVLSSIDYIQEWYLLVSPREYTLKSLMPPSVFGQCVSTLSVGQIVGYQSLKGAGGDQWVSASTAMLSGGLVVAIPMNGFNFAHMSLATALVIAWQTTRILVPTIMAGPNSTTQQKSSTRSVTTIGVGVGLAIAGFLAVVATVAFLMTRRRTAALRTRQDNSFQTVAFEERKSEMTGADQRFEKDPAELKPELGSNQPPNHELPPGSNERVEMDPDG